MRRGLIIALLLGVWAWPLAVLAVPGDADNDNISDVDEGRDQNIDTDGDTIPDYLDTDSDGDGIPDIIEAGDADLATPPRNSDNDALPDFRDVDSDNDLLPDAVEDANGNGKVDDDETDWLNPDTDGDGLKDGQEDRNLNGQVDPGESSPHNSDSDGDGIPDGKDSCPIAAEDFDGLVDDDGCPEIDADGDGIPDGIELIHPCLKPLNPDTDDDGLKDGQEDRDGDGQVDANETNPCKYDTDGDGVKDGDDLCPLVPEDKDGIDDQDGCPEGVVDSGVPLPDGGLVGDGGLLDTDKDGLPDALEAAGCTDPLNPDTDGDGKADGLEDSNRNGRVDEGESDPCHADVRPRGGVGCQIAPEQVFLPLLLGLLLGLGLVRRALRRRL